MEISNEKSKVMVTSKQRDDGNLDNEEVKVDDNTLEEVTRFQYLGSTLNADVTSDNEIKNRLAIATDQLAKLNRIWSANNISLPIKTNPMKSLITSIALYGCESWTYNKMLEKRIEAFEMRCFRRLLGIVWRERISNDEVRNRIINIIGQYEPLLEIARRRKLQWFGHITRRPGTLAHTTMHGMVEGRRGRGRPRGVG